jgi:hypothetical protein
VLPIEACEVIEHEGMHCYLRGVQNCKIVAAISITLKHEKTIPLDSKANHFEFEFWSFRIRAAVLSFCLPESVEIE